VTLILSPPDAQGSANVQCVYDLIREMHIEGFPLPLSEMPTLRSALSAERPRAARLAPSAHATELARLAVRLGTASVGPGIVMPIVSEAAETPDQGGRLLAGLLLISPYSGREWNTDDQSVLEAVVPSLATALQSAEKYASVDRRLSDLNEKLQTAYAEGQAHRERAERLVGSLHAAEAELEREASRANSLAAQLHTDSEVGAALEAAIAERARLEGDLRLALTEVAELTSEVGMLSADRDRVRDDVANKPGSARPAGEPLAEGERASAEVIAAITQELRQPMSSITGYTDLLLAESVGILGALQRKFLERVKASTERMGTLLEDLIRVTSIDSGTLRLESAAVDVSGVIDEAIMACSAQFRDKGISLLMDVDEALPSLKADRDALQQILSHLLLNACLASPPEGEVSLSAGELSDNGDRRVLLAVRDTGGGIPPEEQGRVFSRLYRADNPLIPGLGETGVGLSIAKVLVESHGGRIWVETEAGVGSTFNVLLPAGIAPTPELPYGNSPLPAPSGAPMAREAEE
jgi:signal transduction histidine kinase